LSKKREIKEKIFHAFQRSSHRYRTARGLAKDTGISIAEVTRFLKTSPGIIRSRKAGSHGQALYALQNKQTEKAPFIQAEGNRVVDEKNSLGREKLKYFVLLPFDASMNRLRDTIKRSILEEGAEAFFVVEISVGAAWVDEIFRLIRTSDAVIADITRLNPNVMFELGVAHGLRKPIILLLSEDADVDLPTDLVGYQYLTYSKSNLSLFREKLKRTARQLEARKGAMP